MGHRGTIVQRGENTFRLAVELPPDPMTGERRRKFETFHGARRDAEKRLTDLLGKMDQGKLVADPKVTVAQFLDRWLVDHVDSLAPLTAQGYRRLVKHQIMPHLGGLKLSKLSAAHIVRWQATLRDSPRVDGRPGKLSPQTVKHAFRVLHAALECAVTWELLAANPADRLHTPSVQRKEMKTFTPAEAMAFLAAAEEEGTKWQALFRLALTSGLRLGELLGLRWVDLDLDNGVLRVQQNMQRVIGQGRLAKQPKTSGSRRPIALGGEVVALLRRHRSEQAESRLQMGPLWKDHGLVFPSEVGTPLEASRVHRVFTRTCERAGVPRIRPYDMRHTAASLLLASGVHPKVVSERLGHSNINLTLSTYSHVLPTLQKDAADTLDALLRRPKS